MTALEDGFVVERIEGRKEINGTMFYLVKWDGWPQSHNTWEPESNLGNIKFMIDEFNRKTDEGELTEECLNALKEKQLNDSSFGSFRFGDVPLRLLQLEVVHSDGVEQDINCVVAWAQRRNGEQPKNSIVTNSTLKSRSPLVLIDYFESKVRQLIRRERNADSNNQPSKGT